MCPAKNRNVTISASHAPAAWLRPIHLVYTVAVGTPAEKSCRLIEVKKNDKISEEAKAAIDNADIIFSKGQANYESFAGEGHHAFYTFLCKCDLFINRFGSTLSFLKIRGRDSATLPLSVVTRTITGCEPPIALPGMSLI